MTPAENQPQDQSQFNPFDDIAEEPVNRQQNKERHGDDIIDEIDDVLNDMSDSDDDNEYRSFV